VSTRSRGAAYFPGVVTLCIEIRTMSDRSAIRMSHGGRALRAGPSSPPGRPRVGQSHPPRDPCEQVTCSARDLMMNRLGWGRLSTEPCVRLRQECDVSRSPNSPRPAGCWPRSGLRRRGVPCRCRRSRTEVARFAGSRYCPPPPGRAGGRAGPRPAVPADGHGGSRRPRQGLGPAPALEEPARPATLSAARGRRTLLLHRSRGHRPAAGASGTPAGRHHPRRRGGGGRAGPRCGRLSPRMCADAPTPRIC